MNNETPKWTFSDLHVMSGDTFYIVTKSGKITEMTNSEWGQLRICDTM